MRKLDALRSKIKGKATAVVEDEDNNIEVSNQPENIEKEDSQVDIGDDQVPEVEQNLNEQKEGPWTPVLTRRKAHWANNENSRGHSFKFLNHLTLDSEFLGIVNQHWRQEGEGYAMYRLMRNLEHIKPGLIDLNQRKFRDINIKESQAREKLDTIQELLQSDPLNIHLQKMEKEAKKFILRCIRLL
ncbi:hypothetical protein RIF29_00871 [Crotalaria pallida]|uniref:Uncharacterized protein n=1 Tax=Crotalaria pallida TaxID=3830 RepID=A0AAN9IW84_CROPI